MGLLKQGVVGPGMVAAVERYYPELAELMADQGRPLPRYVGREFDEILPQQPTRQWVLSVPFQLRFLFASQPAIMEKALGIVYRTISTHITKKAGYTKTTGHTGAVTLIQRFGGAINLNHGVFAPNTKHRALVTSGGRGKGKTHGAARRYSG